MVVMTESVSRNDAPALRKQAAAGAEHEGVDHQQVLIDQVSGHQRGDQFPAAHDHKVAAGCLLERGHRGRDIAV